MLVLLFWSAKTVLPKRSREGRGREAEERRRRRWRWGREGKREEERGRFGI